MTRNPLATIGRYFAQTAAEFGKVVAPTGRRLAGWALACALFTGSLMVLVTAADYGLGRLVMAVFG